MSFIITTQFDINKYLSKVEYEDNDLDIGDYAIEKLLGCLSKTLRCMSAKNFRFCIHMRSYNNYANKDIYARVIINKETEGIKAIELMPATDKYRYDFFITSANSKEFTSLINSDVADKSHNEKINKRYEKILLDDYHAKSCVNDLSVMLLTDILLILERLADSNFQFFKRNKESISSKLKSAKYDFEDNKFVIELD